MNVGCERCMAPAVSTSAINDAFDRQHCQLDPVRADDICINVTHRESPYHPIEGRFTRLGRRLPAGWAPRRCMGARRTSVGRGDFTHWPEGTAHKNRMQGNDYVPESMY